MERPKPPSLAQEFADLELRFQRAVATPRKKPAPGRNHPRTVTERKLNYLPSYRITKSDIPGIETFVVMLEKMKAFKSVNKNSVAERLLGQALSLAKTLDEELPGNDGAVKFLYEGTRYLEDVNPELGEDVQR